jgi:hypothetical protein
MLLVVRPTAHAQNVDVRIPGSAVLAPRDYQPAGAPAGPVSLADAVRSTMLGSPAIALQAQEAERARGQQQEATGAFDDVLLISPGVSLVNQPITPAIRNAEIRKRKILGIVADAFDDLYHTMRTIAENTSTDLPVCPSGIRFDFPFNALERTDKQELQLLGTTRPLFSTSLANVRLDIGGVDVSQICSRDVSNGISAEILKPYWNLIDFSGGLGINGILTSAGQIRKEAFLHLTKITESVGSRIRLNFERLGPVPTVQLQRDFTIETSFNKFLRSGIGFDASLRLHSEEFGFGDKIMDPNYGGFDLAPFFPSTATGTLTAPFGKGQGSAYVAAPERAATVTVAAQQERLRHTVTEDTFRTVLA